MKKTFASLSFFAALVSLIACGPVEQAKEKLNLSEKEKSEVVDKSKPPKTVAWLTLKGSVGSVRLLSGQISAAETTNLAFESSGKIQSIAVGLGDNFRKGQRLATLDKTNYQLQLRQAKAAYGTAIANRDQAGKEVKRFERLVRAQAASEIQLDGYRLQYRTAQEAINNAQAQIELAQKQLSDTALIAPFNGVVTAQLGEVGQLASPQVPIFRVEANALPEVSLSVPENLIAAIKPKQKVIVTIPAQPSIGRLSAMITEIATQANFGAFPVKMVLDNAPTAVKAGMTAEVALPMLRNAGGFQIPPSALGAGADNRYFVYRIVEKSTKDGTNLTIETVPVTVDSLSDESVTIHGNLRSDDKLVRSGWSFLTPNQHVQLMGDGAMTINP